MTLYKWSQTASADATADSTVNWAEGQSPSSVNDSARAMMAAIAKYRDDIAGAIATGGTSTAYTVASYQVFGTLAHMNGAMIAFAPHVTNGATVTLNVDGLGAKPLRTSPGVEVLAATLIAGTPYAATYSHVDAAWYLQGFFGNSYNVPLGGAMMYFGTSAPNSSFVFPYGQAISRTTYSALFSLFSTTYGIGDGTTTFSIPDLRGRVPFGKDDMGGSVSSPARMTTAGGGLDGVTLGAVGGSQNVTLAANQIPTLTSVNASQSISVTSTTSQIVSASGAADNFTSIAGSNVLNTQSRGAVASTGSNSISATYTNSSQATTKTVPPAIVCNYILRVI